MAEKIDLYTILQNFAAKTRNNSIPLEPFIRFLQTSATGESNAAQRLADWAIDTRSKVQRKLEELVHQQKIEMRNGDEGEVIFLSGFYAELVAAAYANINESSDSPLPDEKSLRISVPADQLRPLVAGPPLVAYLANPQTEILPLIKITFSNSNGSALVLSSLLPTRLLEIALVKLRDSLRRHGTLEFFWHKLIARFHAQETHINDFIHTFTSRPNECIKDIMSGTDFSFTIWSYLCYSVRVYVEEQVERVNDRKPYHIAVSQAIDIIQSVSNFYKASAIDTHDKEVAFDGILRMLQELPYLYTAKDIFSFPTPKGKPIVEVYGEKEVSDYIKVLTSSAENSDMPEVIRFSPGGSDEWYVKKERVIPLCAKLIQETASSISQEIKTRWTKKLKDYLSENAMRSDEFFEEMVAKQVALFAPVLAFIARDKRTAIIQEETGPYPVNDMVFNNYKPVPWRTIFKLKRDQILMSCRLSLPLWYSFPLVVKIIAFFRHGPKALAEEKAPVVSKKQDSAKTREKIQSAAQKIAAKALPKGSSCDAYLETLNERWNQNLNKKEREKIKRDVNSIIRNYMAGILKIQARFSITEDMIDDTAHNIIDLNVSLKRINDQNSLHLYIKMYILKLLSDAKF